MIKICIITSFLLFTSVASKSQHPLPLPVSVIYKKVDSVPLKMQIVYPPDLRMSEHYPCVVFFFGGGWINGSVDQFRRQADYFSKREMVCFLVDYRVASRQGTTPFDALRDAKSAIRYIRQHAQNFHILPDSLVAAGGSAGGQLAAATALTDGYNEPSDDLSVSPRPNALVLFNPVIDNGPGGYGFDRIGGEYRNFSPLHNIKQGAPPTIIFLGTKDRLIPLETARYYKMVMEKVGSRCDLVLYEGVAHGFFNKEEYLLPTLKEADRFLMSLNFIRAGPIEQRKPGT